MGKLKWYFSRLKAMDFHEIIWRLHQKQIQKKEYKNIYQLNLPVIEIPLDEKIIKHKYDSNKIKINKNCKNYKIFTELDLFAGTFDYYKYKKRWNAGFQTDNVWPENEFSYSIPCTGRIDIGDIRTNWELNRHYQFSALAKSFYLTNNVKYLNELYDLFFDWNQHNLFLHGVEWNSPMEIAIRVNSWCFTLAFLNMVDKKYNEPRFLRLKHDLEHGILVMTDHITQHYSSYSSANNHLIIELYAVCLVGILFNNKSWEKESIQKLTDELVRQNYSDGVNKEMSLHYQTFIMEAYGLLMLLMKFNNIEIPAIWNKYLSKMSEFVADSYDDRGQAIIFGDNDEGKILNLSGKSFDYYKYILDLMSIILDVRYTCLKELDENLQWLINDDLLYKSYNKKIYQKKSLKCYKQGGYTFIRDKKKGLFIGIDHADLGFGVLAAHGHADALSFQLYLNGKPIFIDSGTYNYHISPKDRDNFRSTKSHNTVLVNNNNQSEILGPFLWGRKARCEVLQFPLDEHKVLIATHDGYKNVVCKRKFEYDDKNKRFFIEDVIEGTDKYEAHFILPSTINIKFLEKNIILLDDEYQSINIKFITNARINLQSIKISQQYNHYEEGTMIILVPCEEEKIKVEIDIDKQGVGLNE